MKLVLRSVSNEFPTRLDFTVVRCERLIPIWIFVVIFWLLNVGTAHAFQGPDAGNATGNIKKLAIVGKLEGLGHSPTYGYGCASVDLGDLEPSCTYQIALQLDNNTLQDIAFDGAKSNCKCSQIEFKTNRLLAHASAPFIIEIRTPEKSPTGEFNVAIELMKAKATVGTINFRAKLAGNLFVQESGRFIVREALKEFRIPFVFSHPIEPRNLVTQLPESLTDIVQVEIEQNADKYFLKLLVEPSLMATDLALGNITLSDKVSGVAVHSNVMIQRSGPVSISPRSLNFYSNAEHPSVYEAAAIVEFAPELVASAGADSVLQISCHVGDKPVAVENKRLTSSLFRLKLTFEHELPEKELANLKLEFRLGGVSNLLETSAFFER